MITTLYILYTAMLIILVAMIHNAAMTIYNDWKQMGNIDTLADAVSTHEIPFGFRTNEDDEDYYPPQ